MGGGIGAAKDQTDQEWNDDNCPMKNRHCFDNVFQFLSHLRKSADGPKYRSYSADKSACQAYQWLPFPTTSLTLPIFVLQRVPQTWTRMSSSETADPRVFTKRYSAQRPTTTFPAVNHEGPCTPAYTTNLCCSKVHQLPLVVLLAARILVAFGSK
jgi:hypothetical protein